MPPTTIHINDLLLEQIDEAARNRRISRDRFIVEACEVALQGVVPDWPEGFFESDLGEEDLGLLRKAASEMEESIKRLRRSRGCLDM